MNTYRLCFLAVCAAGSLASAQVPMVKTEHGIPDAPTRLTSIPTASTGSILKRHLHWKSKVPLNKTYGEMTPEQQAEVRMLYDKLPAGDEPPFPEKGLKAVFTAIQQGQDALQAHGSLDFGVTVGADGKATNVQDFGGVNGGNAFEMTNYVASVLLNTPYKPALCAGSPCEMLFAFKLKLD